MTERSEDVVTGPATVRRTYTVVQRVPIPLPEGFTEDHVVQDATSKLVSMMNLEGFTRAEGSEVTRTGERQEYLEDYSMEVRVIDWQVDGIQVRVPEGLVLVATAVEPAEGDPPSAAVQLPAPTPGIQILSIKHPLGTERVAVTAHGQRGDNLGYLQVIPISPDEAEVVTAPATAMITLTAVVEDGPEQAEERDDRA